MFDFIKKRSDNDLPRQTQLDRSFEQRFEEMYAYVDTNFIQKQIDEAQAHIAPLANQTFFDFEQAYMLDVMTKLDEVDVGEQFRMLEVMNVNIDEYDFIDKYKPILSNFIEHLINNEPMSFKAIAGMNACMPAVFVAKMAMLRIMLTLYTGDHHHLTTDHFKMKLVHQYEKARLHNKAN